MSKEKVRVGIIGCGVIGKQHLKAAREAEWVELAAVADANPEAARGAAEQFGAERMYKDASALLADSSIDAVVLAIPTNIRTEMALRALDAGKHVLLEKPLAIRSDEIQQLMAAKKELTVGFCSSRFRFLEHAEAARKWIAEGRLGAVRVLRCRVNEPATGRPEVAPPAWRVNTAINGGGIVANWGIYDFDYLLGLTGWNLQPEWITARMWGLADPIADYFPEGADSEVYGTAYIQCKNNVSITYERGEFMAAPRERSWQIIGSEGSISLHMTWPSQKTIVATTLNAETGIDSHTVWEGDEDSSWVDKGALFDFTRAILEGREPATALPQALQLQRIMDGLYASARAQKPVRIEEEGGERA
ncbi:Gfo/Idh/MocA family oxidoreductase [Paenibacillus sp. HB172176]|uniref:Gfo/Idh/MocA family protein n=1 Tax=Paenibacillus sp. HB172176 TaxID=2493690 RepID=UPI00143B20F9|nr:Gfo/Idh/MocA family oxidoreductase [Paenibacillus sp. HB172176]